MPPRVPNTIAVDISKKQDKKTVGGAVSKRLPINLKMEDGSVVKGFYTENTYTNYEERFKELCDNAIKQVKEKGKDKAQIDKSVEFLQDLRDNVGPKIFCLGLDYSSKDADLVKIENNNILSESNAFTRAALYFMRMVSPKFGGERYMEEDLFSNNEALNSAMKEVVNLGYSIGSAFDLAFDSAKMEKGKVTVNKRNNALYEVSEKIGDPDLICKSVNMITTQNGVTSNGTFMLNAKGTDLKDIKPVVVQTKRGKTIIPLVISKETYRDTSKLQVIDYLTGNIDRHMGNMFYNIEYQAPNKQLGTHSKLVLKGLQGIDNDLSFGAIKGDTQVSHMSPLSEIRVIDKNQAEGIMKMKAEDFEKIMRNAGLGRTEVAAGLTRLENLKSAIKSNKIKQIEGDGWGKINLPELSKSKSGTNIWYKISTINKQYMDKTKGEISLDDFQNKQKEQPTTEVGEIKNESMKLLFETQLDGLNKLKEAFDKTKPEKASPEFKNMYDGLKDVIEEIQKKAIDKEPGPNDINGISMMLKKQAEISAKYISKKSKNPFSDNGKERLHLAKNMLEQINTGRHMVLEESTASFHRSMTAASDKIFAKYQPLIDIQNEIKAQGKEATADFLADKVKQINEIATQDIFKNDNTFDIIASGLEKSILGRLGQEKAMELLGVEELTKCREIGNRQKSTKIKDLVDRNLLHEAQNALNNQGSQNTQGEEKSQGKETVQNFMGF